jgi:geranylgeranyl diphosphate synthase type I
MDIWMAEHDEDLSVERYFDMIGRKTAALIAASIEAGAILATEDETVIDRYRAFGWDLGIAFQLNDDLLGIWGREHATGKEPTDVPRKKKTLPVIYAFERAARADRERLAALYANGRLTPEHTTEIVEILERTGAREYTRDQARLHRDRALAALDAAGTLEREPRARLEEIITSVISA